jgi:HD superfamily phosphohydrolase YqeK
MATEKYTEKLAKYTLYAVIFCLIAALCWYLRSVLVYILGAVVVSLLARPIMTLLDKIIYIADYMEPNRTQAPNLAEIRHLAFIDIDECLYRILEASLAYLKSKNVVIDPITEETYLYYKKQRNK